MLAQNLIHGTHPLLEEIQHIKMQNCVVTQNREDGGR